RKKTSSPRRALRIWCRTRQRAHLRRPRPTPTSRRSTAYPAREMTPEPASVWPKRRGRRTAAGPRVDHQLQPANGDQLDALRHRPAVFPYSCPMPAKSDPAEIGDVEPLADSTARQARRVVAAYATDADECRIFLSMLGIGPSKLEA